MIGPGPLQGNCMLVLWLGEWLRSTEVLRSAADMAGNALAGYWLLKPLYTGEVQAGC